MQSQEANTLLEGYVYPQLEEMKPRYPPMANINVCQNCYCCNAQRKKMHTVTWHETNDAHNKVFWYVTVSLGSSSWHSKVAMPSSSWKARALWSFKMQNYLPSETMSHATWLGSPSVPLWEPQILHLIPTFNMSEVQPLLNDYTNHIQLSHVCTFQFYL